MSGRNTKFSAPARRHRMTTASLCAVLFLTLMGTNCGEGGAGPTEPQTPVSVYLPSLPGYTTTDVEGSVSDALEDLNIDLGTVGNFAVDVLDQVSVCLAGLGVLDIKLYVNATLPADAGLVGVVRRTGIVSNVSSCVLGGGGGNNFIDPCADAGTFQAEGDVLAFGYTGSSVNFCSAVEAHFAQFNE